MEQHELLQFPPMFVNPKDKMGLEHICHPLLDLPDYKIYTHAILRSLIRDIIFQSSIPSTVTDYITLTQIFSSGYVFSTC